MFCKSGILIFIFARNNYLVRQYIGPHHVDENTFDPSEIGSPCLSLPLFLFLTDSLELKGQLHNPGNISLFPSLTFLSSTLDHQVPAH